MSSSTPSAEAAASASNTPLTVVAGWQAELPVPADPIGAWIDLMDVVEALCPEWPESTPTVSDDFRL